MPRCRFSVLLIMLLLSVSTWGFVTQWGMRPPKVLAQIDDALTGWASTPPTLDGVISSSEWASAISAAYITTGGTSGVFYIMNDAVNLYMAIVTEDLTLSVGEVGTDAVMVYFDNDHDHAGPESGDEILGWEGYLGEGFKDGFSEGTYSWRRDTDFGGTSDGAAAAANNGTCNHFEIVHPLNTTDDSHDFSLSMHESLQNNIGFAIRLAIDGMDRGWWPSSDPASWMDVGISRPMLSAWAWVTPMIDGLLNPGLFPFTEEEWKDADRMDFVLSWGGDPSHNVSLYVKNDYVNLYLALEIHGEDYAPLDRVVFNFDNNDDGENTVGDNQAFVEAGNYFQDAFFLTVGGPSSHDVASLGTNDGVGASKFTPTPSSANGSYVFEAALPLNTTDDSHDFSLRVHDRVGFNVLYLDNGDPVAGDGWPTFTQSDWTEMAQIEIDDTALTPDESALDLSIRKIEVTQAVQWLDDDGQVDNSLPLVRGKDTVVRVYVDVGEAEEPVDATEVYVYATDGVSGLSLADPQVPMPVGPMMDVFTAPVRLYRREKDHTANFVLPPYWVGRGSLTLKAFVKTWVGQGEADYDNNWMMFEDVPEQTFSFKATSTLTIHMVPMDVTWATPSRPTAEEMSEQEEFLQAIYPLADVNFIRHSPWRWDGESIDEAIRDLNLLAIGLGVEYPNQVFGMLPGSVGMWGGKSNPDWDIPGYDGLRIVTAGTTNGSTSIAGLMAHEIIHNLGPGVEEEGGVKRGWGLHTFSDADWPHFAENIVTYGASGAWEWPLVVWCLTPEIMSYNQAESFPIKWISPYRWENLFNLFDPPEAASSIIPRQSGEGIVVSGWISENGTGVIDPIFRLSGVQLSPSSSGNYSLVLRNGTGTALFTSSFEARFVGIEGEEQDPYYFTAVLPYASSASSISLWNGTTLLDQIAATSYAPQVQVVSPNGGETTGTLFTVAWTAYDPDEDPLAFIVLYSGDDGLTWTPVSPRITETYYAVDASRLPGGSQSLIRVVASDGFHTSSDESDSQFSVPQKIPLDVMARCVGLSEGGTVNLGKMVLLKGRGFDPEDGELNDSAFLWASSLNGALGVGKTLAIASLRPGVHNITLTAVDSHGNNSTYSFEVTVVHHDVAVTSITPEKTVIGAGYDLALNVTLRNQGLSPENVSLTLIFYEIDASFVHVELYGSSTSGWGTDQTRLTRPGPTIMVRQWDAIQLTLHSVDKFLCNFFVDYNGDGAPTEGEPRSPDFTSTAEYRFVADTPGTFVYYCSYHSSMMFGTFVVDEPDILSYYQERVPNEEILGSAEQEHSYRQHANFTNGYYAVGVFAGPVFNEVKTLDNMQTEGLIIVTIPGDVEGDRDVDIFDIVRMAGVYGVTKPNPSYHPDCDVDGDGDIDIFDIVIAAGHYGQSW